MELAVFDSMRVKFRWSALALLDRGVTSPVLRWLWSDHGGQKFTKNLGDFRPCDSETVREMMSGRYLFAGRLVDTHGASPFSAQIAHLDWRGELYSFSWLRHFRDIRDDGGRRFARLLVLDWIGRYRRFDAEMWNISLTSQRVMNWLRHLNLLVEGASAEQTQLITGALFEQIQSLKIRARFARDPADALMARIALVGAALCDGSTPEQVRKRLGQLEVLLSSHIDEDGMHKSRNPAAQIRFLTELVALRQAIAQGEFAGQSQLTGLVKLMQNVPVALTLGTGELGYFNGCGQQAVDLVFALQAQGDSAPAQNGVIGGYGVLRDGDAIVVADAGKVPDVEFSGAAHAGALSFEFSYGTEMIVANCGPAPAELWEKALLFRQGSAHSCPTVGGFPAVRVAKKGVFAGRLIGQVKPPEIVADVDDIALQITNFDYLEQLSISAERRLTLMSNGNTLVGQDKFTFSQAHSDAVPITIRFHLGPGIEIAREDKEDILRLKLPSGEKWSFLWEGATVKLDDSVRQSAHFGFYRTKQIVVERMLDQDAEIAWILTRNV